MAKITVVVEDNATGNIRVGGSFDERLLVRCPSPKCSKLIRPTPRMRNWLLTRVGARRGYMRYTGISASGMRDPRFACPYCGHEFAYGEQLEVSTDLVGGDVIEHGDISGSSGVALGRGAQARTGEVVVTGGDVPKEVMILPVLP